MEKSTALQEYLLDKNYVVLTTDIPVGDIVEYSIDWVIDVITVVSSTLAYKINRLDSDIDRHQDWLEYIDDRLTHLGGEIEWTDFITLGDYYDLKFTHDIEILDRFAEVVSPLTDEVTDIRFNLDLLTQRVGDGEGSLIDVNIDLSLFEYRMDELEGEFTEDGVRRWNLFQYVWLFFRDPGAFFYNVIDEVIVRFF